MKLVGKLKESVAKAENKEQAKETIKQAGMELTDEEMDKVSGGDTNSSGMELPYTVGVGQLLELTCPTCGEKMSWFSSDPLPTCPNFRSTCADPSYWGLRDRNYYYNPPENHRTI